MHGLSNLSLMNVIGKEHVTTNPGWETYDAWLECAGIGKGHISSNSRGE